jgi:hypothetical protein
MADRRPTITSSDDAAEAPDVSDELERWLATLEPSFSPMRSRGTRRPCAPLIADWYMPAPMGTSPRARTRTWLPP